MIVVLPAPFGPSRPSTCPVGTDRVSRSSTTRDRNRWETSTSSTSGLFERGSFTIWSFDILHDAVERSHGPWRRVQTTQDVDVWAGSPPGEAFSALFGLA